MTTNFVTFYLIIVLITGPFFQFIPMPAEALLWDEILLAKILNQAPTIFLLFYLLSQRKKIQQHNVFILLIGFLVSCIASEIYYYFVSPQILLFVSIAHNFFTYLILIALLRQKALFKNTNKSVVLYASFFSGLITLGFSFSAFSIYKEYLPAQILVFFILIFFIISAIIAVFLSFFIQKSFQRNWYEVVIGTFLIIVVDIYTFTCIFVLNLTPDLLYTIGKVLFSIGVLLLVDGILRNKIKTPQLV